MKLTTADIAVLRDILTAAREAGWQHLIYGGDGWGREHQHVWRSSKPYARVCEQIDLWHGAVEYRPADKQVAKSVMQVESAADVRDWLRTLRLVPSVADVATAALTPDCASLPVEVGA